MRLFRFLLFFIVALPVFAADRITISLTVTNGTTNGMTFVLNGSTRTFTNNVQVSSIQVLTNTTHTGTKTNLYNNIALNPFGQVTMINGGASNISFVGASGVAMAATVGGTPSWGFVTYSTQTVATLTAVRVPVSGEPTAAVRTNIGSGLVAAIEDYSTNSLNQNSTAASELVGLTNAQTITGIKQFSAPDGQWFGQVTSTNINGIAGYVTNGLFKTNTFDYPTTSNLVNYGSAIRSPGSGNLSEQFGASATASGIASTAVGYAAIATNNGAAALGTAARASGGQSSAIGTASIASDTSATAVGNLAYATASSATAIGTAAVSSNQSSVAIGASARTTGANQIRLGTSSEYVSIPGNLHVVGYSTNNTMIGTNVFPSGADISFGRYALTTLANGNNAAIPVGTNVFVQVSGPSAAFSIAGIDGNPNRDGKLLFLVNQTGFPMTLLNQSGIDVTPANRIVSLNGTDRPTIANGSATLIYSGSASRWILLGMENSASVYAHGSLNCYTGAVTSAASAGPNVFSGWNESDVAGGIGLVSNTYFYITNAGTYEILFGSGIISGAGDACAFQLWTNNFALSAANQMPASQLEAIMPGGTPAYETGFKTIIKTLASGTAIYVATTNSDTSNQSLKNVCLTVKWLK